MKTLLKLPGRGRRSVPIPYRSVAAEVQAQQGAQWSDDAIIYSVAQMGNWVLRSFVADILTRQGAVSASMQRSKRSLRSDVRLTGDQVKDRKVRSVINQMDARSLRVPVVNLLVAADGNDRATLFNHLFLCHRLYDRLDRSHR